MDDTSLSDRLIIYLREKLGNPNISYRSPLQKLTGGYETAIYHFQLGNVDEAFSRPLVLRLYPKSAGVNNPKWESAIQNGLADLNFPTARVRFVCTDPSVHGGAFLVMDFIEGSPLLNAPSESIPGILGKRQADLHRIPPEPLIQALADSGFGPNAVTLNSQVDGLKRLAEKHAWVREPAQWLMDNRPPEPERLSICHGDFHPLNILAEDGKVTGVLDWAGMRIAGPAYDLGNTLILLTIPLKHLSKGWRNLSTVDWDGLAASYLSEYQAHAGLTPTHLDYYQVRRCVQALIEGAEGQEVWQDPNIIADLQAVIKRYTGLDVALPD